MNPKVVSFLALLLLFQSCYGDIVELYWIPLGGEGFPDETVQPGDSVIFTYTAMHNVYIHPSGNCSEAGAILVGDRGEGTASYNFTEADAGTTVFFACDYGSHCELGLSVKFNVQEIASMVPSGAPSSSIVPIDSSSPSSAAPTTSAAPPATTEPTPSPPTGTTDRSQDTSTPRKMTAVTTVVGSAVAMLSLI
eukprot:scaffold7176_cov134-Cylindrotheca_fusiformis.AAC.5